MNSSFNTSEETTTIEENIHNSTINPPSSQDVSGVVTLLIESPTVDIETSTNANLTLSPSSSISSLVSNEQHQQQSLNNSSMIMMNTSLVPQAVSRSMTPTATTTDTFTINIEQQPSVEPATTSTSTSSTITTPPILYTSTRKRSNTDEFYHVAKTSKLSLGKASSSFRYTNQPGSDISSNNSYSDNSGTRLLVSDDEDNAASFSADESPTNIHININDNNNNTSARIGVLSTQQLQNHSSRFNQNPGHHADSSHSGKSWSNGSTSPFSPEPNFQWTDLQSRFSQKQSTRSHMKTRMDRSQSNSSENNNNFDVEIPGQQQQEQQIGQEDNEFENQSMMKDRTRRGKAKHCFSRFIGCFPSIAIVLSIIGVLMLLIVMSLVAFLSLGNSKRIISSMGTEIRTLLTKEAHTLVGNSILIAKKNLKTTKQLIELNIRHTWEARDEESREHLILNAFRSAFVLNQDLIQMNFVDRNRSFLVWEQVNTGGFRSLVTSPSQLNGEAIFESFDSLSNTTAFATGTTKWSEYQMFADIVHSALQSESENDVTNERSSNEFKEILVSPVIIRKDNDHAAIMSMYLNDSDGRFYGTLSIMFNVDMLQRELASIITSDNGYALIIGSEGQYVTSSQTKIENGTKVPIYSVNESDELMSLDAYIRDQIGSWSSIATSEKVVYCSVKYGRTTIFKQNISFENTTWYVMVSWPTKKYHGEAVRGAYYSIGVAFLVLLVFIFICLMVIIPLIRNTMKMRQCFKLLHSMKLEDPLLADVMGTNFIWSETSELQSILRSLVLTLKNFQKYVPKTVLQKLVQEGAQAKRDLAPEVCSIFFLDIKDFSKNCEEMDTKLLVQLVEEAFERVSVIITDGYDGIIDKYIGDCVMAIFTGDQHELRAANCAIDCKEAFNRLATSWSNRGLPVLQCGIGVNSGEVLLGNFGSSNRFNFTAIGDAVNLASRVEGLNRLYDSTILITEHVLNALPSNHFVTRRLEKVKVKGRNNSVVIYELKKRYCADTIDSVEAQDMKIYEEAINEYFSGNFSGSKQLLRKISNADTDKVLLRKIQQCDTLSNNDGTWSGVLRMKYK